MKLLYLILLIMTFSTCIPGAQAMTNNSHEAIRSERRQANLIDAALFTLVTQAVNDYFLQNQKLSLLASACWGVGAWLTGEVAEMIYKKIYQKIAGQPLRNALGKIEIFGIEFDNQRLLRRIISLIPLCVGLYFSGGQ